MIKTNLPVLKNTTHNIVIVLMFLLNISINVEADNTIVPEYPYYPPSTTWVEEDYFTQQEKYCEVDSIYAEKLDVSLEQEQQDDKERF